MPGAAVSSGPAKRTPDRSFARGPAIDPSNRAAPMCSKNLDGTSALDAVGSLGLRATMIHTWQSSALPKLHAHATIPGLATEFAARICEGNRAEISPAPDVRRADGRFARPGSRASATAARIARHVDCRVIDREANSRAFADPPSRELQSFFRLCRRRGGSPGSATDVAAAMASMGGIFLFRSRNVPGRRFVLAARDPPCPSRRTSPQRRNLERTASRRGSAVGLSKRVEPFSSRGDAHGRADNPVTRQTRRPSGRGGSSACQDLRTSDDLCRCRGVAPSRREAR